VRRITLYVLVSVFTFVIGVALTTFDFFRRYAHWSDDSTITCSAIQPPQYQTIESTILKGVTSSWKFDEITTAGKENLHAIKFINANEGWVGGSNAALYKTTNTGKEWQKIPLDIPLESDILSISFVNSSTGWLVAKAEYNRSIRGYRFDHPDSVQSWLLNTTDGGKTWQTQYYEKSLDIRRVQFVDEREGWAIGSKLVKAEQEFDKDFVIRTTDGGRHWTDLSANAAGKGGGYWDSSTNILATAPSNAMTRDSVGKLYRTTNGGKSWTQVGSLPEERSEEFLGRFELTGGNRMWAVGGKYGMFGTRDMTGILARMDSGCFWRKYTVRRAYFADAAFVSENEILACGAIRDPDHNSARWDSDGLIANSTDGGANWTIVYQSSDTGFGTMTKVDSQNIWVIGTGGVIVHLQPK